jgi:hypothetical protein
MTTRLLIATIAKWAGRVAALLVFLLWGAFFVEHLSEWFRGIGGHYPPPWVWVSQAFHFVILAGLAMMLKWDRLGTIIMIIGTAGFVASVGDLAVLKPMLINLVPVACFSVYWLARRS